MKLLSSLIVVNGLASGSSDKDPRSFYCDTTELTLPTNAEKWDCTGVTGNLVPAGDKCKLKCDNGFEPIICKYLILEDIF